MFLVFLLLNAVHVEYSRCERFNIVPSPDSPCPGEFTGEPCLTLQQYVANPSLSSNITLELHPGNHQLDSQLSVSTINLFTMRAYTSATVTCNQELYEPFYFYRLQQVHVSGITFISCRMHLQYTTNAILETSSFVNRTRCCASGAALYVEHSTIVIRQCFISNNRMRRGAIYSYRSPTLLIEKTTFIINYPSHCCNYGRALHLIESGNIAIYTQQ